MPNTPKTGLGAKIAKNGSLLPNLMFIVIVDFFIRQQKGDATCGDNPSNHWKDSGQLVNF